MIENNDTVAIETSETVEPVVDADVLAALAGDDDSETITAEDVEPASDEEVLAALTAPAPKAKRSKKGDSTPAAAPAIMRDFTAVAQIDQSTLDGNLAGCNAKKVREKADNLIAAIQSGKRLSRYTAIAVEALHTDGRFSGKSMVEAFQGAGLSLGTSRAQGQQMTALFRLVGAVAPEAGSKDLVVQDTGLINELHALAA